MSIFAGVLLAMLLGALDNTIVGPAMPKIVQDLGGMAHLAWVFTIYSLTSTIAIPIIGKLSDLYGRKWFYIVGIVIFLIGSALSGAAGEGWLNGLTGNLAPMTQLILFRGLQGIGGGMMMANAMAIIGDLFDPRERARYQGFTGAVFGFSSVFGPMIGGWLTDSASWRWIFYINLPIGLITLIVLLIVMPKPVVGRQHRIDWWGSLALVVGLVPLLLALSWGGSQYAWRSTMILGLLAAAAVGLLLFIVRELYASEPILDMRLFTDRSFSASMAVLFLSGVGMFGSIMFLPTFMQVVQGKSASGSGALLMPLMLSMIAGSISSGQFISRTGKYKTLALAGLAIAVGGMFALSRLAVDSSNLYVMLCMIGIGFGIGITMPIFTISLQSQFPKRIGEVTGALQFFRSIGGTVGVALLGGVMNAQMRSDLAARVGSEGIPPLKVLWATQPQPGPFSPQGMPLLLARFADQLPAGGEKFFTEFVDGLQVVVNGNIPRSFDPSALLNVSMMEAVTQLIAGVEAQLPAAVVSQLGLGPAWGTLTFALRSALTAGVTHAFLYATALLALAFVAMLAVREIPLLARPRFESAAEIATELFVEEAVQPAAHEPVVGRPASDTPEGRAPVGA